MFISHLCNRSNKDHMRSFKVLFDFWVPQNQRPEDSYETLCSFQQSGSYPLYKQPMPVCTAPTLDQMYVFGRDFYFLKCFEYIILLCHVNCPVSLILMPLLPFHFPTFFQKLNFSTLSLIVTPFFLQFEVHVPVHVGEYHTKPFSLCWYFISAKEQNFFFI